MPTSALITGLVAFLALLAIGVLATCRQRGRLALAAFLLAPVAAAALAVVTGALLTPSPPVAERATAAPDAAPAAAKTPPTPPPVTEAPPATTAGPDIEALRQTADGLRRARRYAEAKEAYGRLLQANPRDADAWADLADATAAAAGGDLEGSERAIEHALLLAPNHTKALWLKASLALQRKRYGEAADLWQKLLDQLPKDSADAQVVTANLQEARTLARQSVTN